MKKVIIGSFFLISLFFVSCKETNIEVKNSKEVEKLIENPSYNLVRASEVEWNHLNPKRGDLAPKAGTLWGDRNGTEATGFLLKPNDGFQSPPHIHNVSYRGIVIDGLLHNDDPNAANMWMENGSYWTQPKGHVHITAAKGSAALAYIEIEEGPYHVLPVEEEFDSGERPINADRTNMVWVNSSDFSWVENTSEMSGVQMAFLWGEANSLNGTFLKVPSNFNGKIHTSDKAFRAVVIRGNLGYQEPHKKVITALEQGSMFSSEEKSYHTISNATEKDVLIYIRSVGKYKVK